MNKKSSVKKTAALIMGIALCVGGVGCDNFVLTDNAKDLAQTVATVNISKGLKNDPRYSEDTAKQVGAIVDNLSNDISKRDLVAYFLSTGYQYVESYGYSYEDTFNMLMDGLVSREIMIQYAIAYYIQTTELSEEGCKAYIDAKKAEATDKVKELYAANPEVLTLQYFLTENDGDTEDYKRAVYNLKKSLNTSLDSLEANYIKEDDEEEEDTTETRTLPTGVDTTVEDYYTEDYDVYTGSMQKPIDQCGEYIKDRVDGSTTNTRQKAYNAFLANLQGYNMIKKSEDTSDVTLLNYYYVELSSSLGQALINKYFEALQDEIITKLDADYVTKKYQEVYATQVNNYETSPTAFSTALDGVSDSSFMLYGLKDFGFVYNILLPFSAEQEIAYTQAKNNKANTQDDLYAARREILNNVEGKDLRGSWISKDEDKNHSYVEEDKYYFFKDNLVEGAAETTKYEQLTQYAGKFAYQGTVDEEGKATPTKIKIGDENSGFIKIFEDYIKATVGEGVTLSGAKNAAYDSTTKFTNEKKEVEDYSPFVYYSGKVNGLEDNAKDVYFKKDSKIYKTVSAVNELMFAYSTDTGCLNKYLGYSVSPYSTNFVKEFEYAAREAIKGGVGSYVVCATDYGWHIVFASYVYTQDGAVYAGYDHAQKDTEGTFSNLFYESLKDSTAQNYSTEVQNDVLNRYNNDDSVKLYKSRYKDLLEMDN